jgi:hypothetical protein
VDITSSYDELATVIEEILSTSFLTQVLTICGTSESGQTAQTSISDHQEQHKETEPIRERVYDADGMDGVELG